MKTTAAVIDFGTNKIVTVMAESGAFSRCEIRGTGTVPYSGYQKGEWLEPIELPGQVKQSIAAAELEAKATINEIFVSVPAEFLRIRLSDAEVPVASEDGRITEDDMDAVHDAAADVLGLGFLEGIVVHRSPAWFSVDGGKKTMTPIQTAKRGRMLRALTSFIIAEEAFVKQMTELFASMQIVIRGFVAPALGEAILYIPTEERDRTAVLMDVGYLNTEISVVEGDAIVYHKVLPVGGGFITADLVENLEIDLESAERLKREFSFEVDELSEKTVYSVSGEGGRLEFGFNHVAGAMSRTMDELLSGVEGALKEAGAAVGSTAKVFLTGGGLAPMKGTAAWLSDQLDRTVKVAQANSSKLNGPWFASVLGELDQIFDTLEPRTAQQESLPGRLMSGMKNLLRKEEKAEPEQE
ncbi:MAG: cell division FtsA domain-containing protein [Eubacteriales bacterium]|nr:cell division FtsA domain-containing protein [Eubacteriales bacterium]